MKTTFAFLTACLITFSGFANDNDEELRALSDVRAQYKTINVLLKDAVGESKITIMDQNGKQVHKRKVKDVDSDVVIPYNMDEMPIGEYQVKITTEDAEVIYAVNTSNRAIPVEELPLKAHGRVLDDNTLNLAVFGLLEPGLEVQIRYEDSDRIFHSEVIDTPNAFKKNFKLKGVDASDVYFQLTDAIGRTRVIHFEP